ncbi:hypothetical protein OIB37_23335 [Streptomyces sp. NBC_00820]|uniref:hypothetical protein n=1 Tax=Streptomyces sp. NBC_00820 TaxID=2975842 RepID=UPI002ED3E688|nr:hypothetical protein OIB37_23335 [Streptomyces sp. NBC_00820]
MAGTEPTRAGNGVPAGSVGTRLNHVPADAGGYGPPAYPGPAGGQPDLRSSPAEKKAAAKAIAEHIEPDTRKAGDWADTETNSAVTEFRDGWHTSGALKKAHEAWADQVRSLMHRLSSEKAALQGTNTLLQNTDLQTGANARSVSVLNEY